ncbi:hypothetical protein PCANC_18053 [Puccinia coronata f. sp. avenae]|uniref:Uncharacterized protein n=1 Tax=Puccinia coronata f. sp. avenae TaxID=200324 RepID=A0A2N5U8W7_9BASI|nr:hypothetical protein PCASD_15312 [Puccinia coronata f. sp. avenae]PLW34174.1 hypothetical protein PCASD_13314 [Puccinia coronata f. sp. avenae]PLW37767.1 hypothetical protein PCANC_18053 [Puccinia coronata f. sp. avenae]
MKVLLRELGKTARCSPRKLKLAHPIASACLSSSSRPAQQQNHPGTALAAPPFRFHFITSHPSLSPTDQAYLQELSHSFNSQSYHQLSSPAFSQILHHLHSHDLFKHLSAESYDLLLHFTPTSVEENQSTQSTHYYLYHRIIFLLDRIYERQHLFSQSQLDRFHSISLKQLAHAGLFKPAELIWDQLISHSTTQPQSRPTDDQIFMLDCIRTALLHHEASIQSNQQKNPSSSSTHSNHPHHDHQSSHQELLPLSSKDFKRMTTLTESITSSLFSHSPLNKIDQVTERWLIRTVAEIFAVQGEITRLSNWLKKQRSLDLDFPDNGANWSDPKLTAIVVRMFKDQGQLDKMVMIYEAALHPSPSMWAHPSSSRSMFEESADTSSDIQESSEDPKKRCGSRRRRTNPILTRTYHDLISACTQANRPHLAIHYLSRAVEDNEAYVNRLPAEAIGFASVPHLRLQPATYAELIPSLVRKKRDTQLRKVYDLSTRLVQTTVRELQWIRLLASNRVTSSSSSSSSLDPPSHPWDRVLAAIVPELSSAIQPDMEAAKAENLGLEKVVFNHANQPSLSLLPTPASPFIEEPKSEEEQTCADWPQQTGKEADEIGFLRTLERAKFLSKSLAHSVRLLQRLDHLVAKTRLNRAIRFQHHLLKKKQKTNMQQQQLPPAPTFSFNAPRPPPPPAVPSSSANHLSTLHRIDSLVEKKHALRFARSSS